MKILKNKILVFVLSFMTITSNTLIAQESQRPVYSILGAEQFIPKYYQVHNDYVNITPSIIFQNNDKIGICNTIGESSPQLRGLLDVFGTISLDDTLIFKNYINRHNAVIKWSGFDDYCLQFVSKEPGLGENIVMVINNRRVGIGVLEPLEELHVDGNILTNGFIMPKAGIESGYVLTTDINGHSRWSPTQNLWEIGENNNIYRLEGNVGIGVERPLFPLEVGGIVRMHGIYMNTGGHLENYVLTSNEHGFGTWQPNLWSRGENNNIYHMEGNVGIGISEPIAVLHVEDPFGSLKYSNANINISSKGVKIPSLSLQWSPGATWNITNESYSLRFKYENGDRAAITMDRGLFVKKRITVYYDMETGFPDSDADIQVIQNGEVNKKAAEFETTEGGRLFFVPRLGNSGYNPISKEKDAGIFWSDTENQNFEGGFVIGPHDTDDNVCGLRIDHEGNLGIGTNNPQSQLEVHSNESSMINVTASGDHDASVWVTNGRYAYGLGMNANGKGYIYHDFNTPEPLMTFYDGKVGIGAEPVYGVAHKLYVAGGITTEEIIVKLQTNWSDFVFDKSYKLQSLKKLEQYIEKNKHLPGIPSEKEVKENGINLGEMNALLLKKIEELTLYILEQDKQIHELNAKVEILMSDK